MICALGVVMSMALLATVWADIETLCTSLIGLAPLTVALVGYVLLEEVCG